MSWSVAKNHGVSHFVVLFLCLHLDSHTLWAEKKFVENFHLLTITSYQQEYDWLNPWNKKEIKTRRGVASVVKIDPAIPGEEDQRFILTSADVVSNATLIEITRKGDSLPFPLRLHRINHALNLALLTPADPTFFDSMKILKWGPARIGETSLTDFASGKREPIVGQIERLTVGHRQVRDAWLPILQVSLKDTPLQGSILFQNKQAVGMILNGSQGTFNALPSQLVLGFLAQENPMNTKGVAHRGFQWKSIYQRSYAEYAGIPPEQTGIWISHVLTYGTGSKVLKNGDYLTHIDDWALTRDGEIEHPKWGSVLFDALFLEELQAGMPAKLTVYRDGKRFFLNTRIGIYKGTGHRVPLKNFGVYPRYLIRGGLLFQELTLNYLEVWGKNWANRAPLRLRLYLQLERSISELKSKEDTSPINSEKRIIILTQVLPDAINIGYQELSNIVVRRVNGKRIQSLKILAEAFDKPIGEFHRIEFSPGNERVHIVLPTDDLATADRRILRSFQIPALQSL